MNTKNVNSNSNVDLNTEEDRKLTPEQREFLSIDKIDPVSLAESMMGVSDYKQMDNNQQLRMLGIGMIVNEAKQAALKNANDVSSETNFEDYKSILLDAGFELAFQEQMLRHSLYSKEDPIKEQFVIFGHRQKGIILRACSYTWEHEPEAPSVNSGEWYAAWKPTTFDGYHHATSSGGFVHEEDDVAWREQRDHDFHTVKEKLVWVGHWDARQGVKSRIANCEAGGHFLPVWPKMRSLPFGMFTSSYDYSDPQYKSLDGWAAQTAFTEARATVRRAQCPSWINDIINNEGV